MMGLCCHPSVSLRIWTGLLVNWKVWISCVPLRYVVGLFQCDLFNVILPLCSCDSILVLLSPENDQIINKGSSGCTGFQQKLTFQLMCFLCLHTPPKWILYGFGVDVIQQSTQECFILHCVIFLV